MSRRQTALDRFRDAHLPDITMVHFLCLEHNRYQNDGDAIGMIASLDSVTEAIMKIVKKATKNGRDQAEPSSDTSGAANVTSLASRSRTAGD